MGLAKIVLGSVGKRITEGEHKPCFQLEYPDAGFTVVEPQSAGYTPVEGVVNGFILLVIDRVLRPCPYIGDAIAYLRTEVKEPAPLAFAEIQVHQEGYFQVMQLPRISPAVGHIRCGYLLPPTALEVVEFYLQTKILMFGISEDESAVSPEQDSI